MESEAMKHHGEMIKNFLKANDKSQKEFCEEMEIAPSNFTITFMREIVSKKYRLKIKHKYDLELPMGDDIAEPPNDGTSIVQINGGNGKQHISLTEKDLYDKLLAAKESEISILRDLVAQLKKQIPEK